MTTSAQHGNCGGKGGGIRAAALSTAMAMAAAASLHPAMAQTYRFKTINIPGATQTSLYAGARGTLLGWAYDSAGNPTCTIIQDKTYTPISDPNGVQTYCYGIDNAGEVVGYYNKSDDSAVGFTYSNGSFSDFSLPDISGALPSSISTNGVIAGYYYDQNNAPWGFTLKGTTVSTFQISGATNIFPVGVNKHGEMAIQELDTSGNVHCLAGTVSAQSELTVPGATETICHAINDDGKVAGTYLDSSGNIHGFTYDPSTSGYYTIDDPGMAATGIHGITNSETLLGYSEATSGGPMQGMKAKGSFPARR
ncbi:MAG TPA: hypothetical protein VKR31_03260 [Rhizomicrobium sp.]|nr:hypothetical protein [Rhizomicrobium sp.]